MPARSRVPGVSATVWALGFTSLLTDISSEMVSSVLPIYLVLFMGMSPLMFGVVDGIYQGAAAIVRVAAGVLSDRWNRHKEVASWGYGLSAASRLLILSAGSAWASIAAIIALDLVGKGIRTAPRDALIAKRSKLPELATAFGVHRSLDAAGAMLGPVAAFALLALMPNKFDVLFVASFGIAIIAEDPCSCPPWIGRKDGSRKRWYHMKRARAAERLQVSRASLRGDIAWTRNHQRQLSFFDPSAPDGYSGNRFSAALRRHISGDRAIFRSSWPPRRPGGADAQLHRGLPPSGGRLSDAPHAGEAHDISARYCSRAFRNLLRCDRWSAGGDGRGSAAPAAFGKRLGSPCDRVQFVPVGGVDHFWRALELRGIGQLLYTCSHWLSPLPLLLQFSQATPCRLGRGEYSAFPSFLRGRLRGSRCLRFRSRALAARQCGALQWSLQTTKKSPNCGVIPICCSGTPLWAPHTGTFPPRPWTPRMSPAT